LKRLFLTIKSSLAVLVLTGTCAWAAYTESPRSVAKPAVPSAQQLFPQGSVRLFDGPFKAMQDVDHAYLLRFDPDRLLAQFRVEARLEPKAKPYDGWESPAQTGNPGEWFQIDLGKATRVNAVQVNFAEKDCVPKSVAPGGQSQRYKLLASDDGQ
jgi:hypothetical protein